MDDSHNDETAETSDRRRRRVLQYPERKTNRGNAFDERFHPLDEQQLREGREIRVRRRCVEISRLKQRHAAGVLGLRGVVMRGRVQGGRGCHPQHREQMKDHGETDRARKPRQMLTRGCHVKFVYLRTPHAAGKHFRMTPATRSIAQNKKPPARMTRTGGCC